MNVPLPDDGTRTVHIVLVPGFFGFDALGQIEYYAGATRLFGTWHTKRPGRVTLHYFDNYPTASVPVRAQRLHNYLARKIDRGEIGAHDRIALVGHSTGGLDIRRMVWALAASGTDPADSIKTSGSKRGEGRSVPVNAQKQARSTGDPQPSAEATVDRSAPGDSYAPVSGAEILTRIDRIVFLSVPHYGTSLADFVSRVPSAFRAVCGALRLAVESNGGLDLDGLKSHLKDHNPVDSHFLLALLDALSESDERPSRSREPGAEPFRVPQECAIERENRAAFSLWLDHMSKDLGVIFDLGSRPPVGANAAEILSPAHYDENMRSQEIGTLRTHRIHTLSFVTLAGLPQSDPVTVCSRLGRLTSPLGEGPVKVARWIGASRWVLGKTAVKGLGNFVACLPGLLPTRGALASIVRELGSVGRTISLVAESSRTSGDVFYRGFSTILSREPLSSKDQIRSSLFTHPEMKEKLDREQLDARASDGVVNTISMGYPFDPARPNAHQIRFVPDCDHADIIGHFELAPVDAASASPAIEGRRYEAYDIFVSNSRFNQARFDAIWTELFEFCVSP